MPEEVVERKIERREFQQTGNCNTFKAVLRKTVIERDHDPELVDVNGDLAKDGLIRAGSPSFGRHYLHTQLTGRS